MEQRDSSPTVSTRYNPTSTATCTLHPSSSSLAVAAMTPLVSDGGHDREVRDARTDTIPPHPTGANQAESSDDCPPRGQVMAPNVASYEEFKAEYQKMMGRHGSSSDDRLQPAFRTYVFSCASSVGHPRSTAVGAWLRAPGLEMARWRREVKMEAPTEPPATFRDLLVYIASFALGNQLERLDHQFRGHLFKRDNPFYDFKRGQVNAINKLYKTVVKTGQGCLYVPKKMRDGYVFVDNSCGLGGGVIRWYEQGGGNPKYSFWMEDGKITVDMA